MATQHGPWIALRILRQRSRKPVARVAAEVGISESHYYALQDGSRWPTDEVTLALARALRVPVAMIARYKDDAACQIS